jgi:hypothetical protein
MLALMLLAELCTIVEGLWQELAEIENVREMDIGVPQGSTFVSSVGSSVGTTY